MLQKRKKRQAKDLKTKAKREDSQSFNLFSPPPPPLNPPLPPFSAILFFLSSSSLINCCVALNFTGAPAPGLDAAALFDGFDDFKTFEAGAARLRGFEKPSLTGAGAGAAAEEEEEASALVVVVVEEEGSEEVEARGDERSLGLGAPKEKESLTSGSRTSPSSTEGPEGTAEGSEEEEEAVARAIWSARSFR